MATAKSKETVKVLDWNIVPKDCQGYTPTAILRFREFIHKKHIFYYARPRESFSKVEAIHMARVSGIHQNFTRGFVVIESELDILSEAINDAEAEIDSEVDFNAGVWGSDDPTDPKFYDDSLTPPEVGLED